MEYGSFVDNMLLHGAWFLSSLAFLASVLFFMRKQGRLDWLISTSYKLAPLIVVLFCVWFFVHVFENSQHQKPTSCDVFHIEASSLSNLSQNERNDLNVAIVSLTKAVNEKIDKVSSIEHDRFRAELSTWLSIFGLLSIIATIVVPVATYKAQYGALEEKLRALDELYDKQKTQSDEIQSQIDDQDARSSESLAFSQNDAKSGDVSYEVLNKCRMEKAEAFSFKIDAGMEFGESIKARAKKTIEILQKINDCVLTKSNDAEILKLALNIINSINVFLGTRVSRESGFSNEFLKIHKERKPLTILQDEMENRISNLLPDQAGIYKGFYNALYLKQK